MMNRNLIILTMIILLGPLTMSFADVPEYSTPGNGSSLILADLAVAAPDVVSSSGGGYWINGLLTISASDTLTISAGTQVVMNMPVFHDGGYSPPPQDAFLKIEGKILAQGADENPVHFKVKYREEINMPWMGLWHQGTTEASIYENCLFEGGGMAIVTDNAMVTITGCEFDQQSVCAVLCTNESTPEITNNTFTGVGRGTGIALMRCTSSTVVENNNLTGFDAGIFVHGNHTEGGGALAQTGGLTITDTTVTGAGCQGLAADSADVTVSNSFFQQCCDGLFAFGDSILSLIGSSFEDNDNAGVLAGEESNTTLNSCILTGNGQGDTGWGYETGGGLLLIGNASSDLDGGRNSLFENSGMNLVNFTPNNVQAGQNYWGGDLPEAESTIWDGNDPDILSQVGFTPGSTTYDANWEPSQTGVESALWSEDTYR